MVSVGPERDQIIDRRASLGLARRPATAAQRT
jgi:hypothetical protein